MPHSEQAKKRLRQDKIKRLRNDRRRRRVHDLKKEIRDLVAAKKAADAAKLLPEAFQALDKAAKNRVIHPNAASRTKSRLAKLVGKAGGTVSAGVPAKKRPAPRPKTKTAPKRNARKPAAAEARTPGK